MKFVWQCYYITINVFCKHFLEKNVFCFDMQVKFVYKKGRRSAMPTVKRSVSGCVKQKSPHIQGF